MASPAEDRSNGLSYTSTKTFQAAVHIQVGPEDQNPVKFIVHPQLLLSTASLFHGTGVVSVKDPDTRTFKFSNRDPVLFGIYVRWLYKQQPQPNQFSDIIGAYLFAVKLDAPAFRNYLLGLMYTKLVNGQYFPTAEELREAWEGLDAGAPLKKLLLDVCVWGTAQPAVGWSQLLKEVPTTFVMDYAMAHASKGNQEAPYANGIGSYEDEVPANCLHPYYDRDVKPDTLDSAFANVLKVRVGASGDDTFYIHQAFFRGLDPQLDQAINHPDSSNTTLNLPQTTAEDFGAFVEWAYFRNNDVVNSFDLGPPAEPDAKPPAEPPTAPSVTDQPEGTSAATPVYTPATTDAASESSRPAPPYSRGYAGSTVERLPLPLGWHFYVSDFRKRLYVDQITQVCTEWDPRAVGRLPQGWTVRLEVSGRIFFENPGSKDVSDQHPSGSSKDWAKARIRTISKSKRVTYGASA